MFLALRALTPSPAEPATSAPRRERNRAEVLETRPHYPGMDWLFYSLLMLK